MNARADFPFFDAADAPVYLDNAATTQKPRCVLDALQHLYTTLNANIHRGTHRVSRLATEAHENARQTVADFLHAASPSEIIFTSGCTEGINLAARVLALSGYFRAGDEIIVSTDAHHSDIVPWQMICERTGARLRPVPMAADLSFDTAAYRAMLNERTRLVTVPVISNALGLRLPVEQITRAARECGALVLLDAAQAVAHEEIDVRLLGCDLLAFSGHKVYAPTGTGVLWGRQELLESLPPWKGGGEMIREVTFPRTTYNDLPFKYEAGTPNIIGNIVLAEALRYVRSIGLPAVRAHERALMAALCRGLRELRGGEDIELLGGDSPLRASLVSVRIPGIHPYDIGTLLDQMNIAVRTGHHCCQPLMQALGITGTTRFSVSLCNTQEDIERAVSAMQRVISVLR